MLTKFARSFIILSIYSNFGVLKSMVDIINVIPEQALENNLQLTSEEYLLDCASRGDNNGVRRALTQGADVHTKNSIGATALHLAAVVSAEEIIELLINQGARLFERDNWGRTALHISTAQENIALTTYLLTKGARACLDLQDSNGRIPLHHAIDSNNEALVKLFLSERFHWPSCAQVTLPDNTGKTALHFAARVGNKKIAQMLIEKGAPLHARDIMNSTAADTALECGHLDMIQLLCKNKDFHAQYRDLLILMNSNAHTDIPIEKSLDYFYPLHRATIENKPRTVVQLLVAGVDPNMRDKLVSWTALHHAVLYNFGRIVRLLLAARANPNCASIEGDTPLHIAAWANNKVLARLLLCNGANPLTRDTHRRTALDIAQLCGYKGMVNLLKSMAQPRYGTTKTTESLIMPRPVDDMTGSLIYLFLQNPEKYASSIKFFSKDLRSLLARFILLDHPFIKVLNEKLVLRSCIRTLKGHTDEVYSAQFNCSGGNKIVSASKDSSAKIWDVLSGECLLTLDHDDWVMSAEFNSTGDVVVTASFDNTAAVWNAFTGECLLTLQHDHHVFSAQFNEAGDRILTCSEDGTAQIWEIYSGECLYTLCHDDPITFARFYLAGDKVFINSRLIKVTDEDSDCMIITKSLNETKLWHANSGNCFPMRQFIKSNIGRVRSARINATDDKFVTCDEGFSIWNYLGECLHHVAGHSEKTHSALFNKTGDRVVTASADKTVKIWDVGMLFSVADWLKRECTAEQAFLLHCIYETIILDSLLKRRAMHSHVKFNFNKHPHLQIYYEMMPQEIREILEPFINVN